MTGLGEFSPIGQLLNMGSFLKITEEALIWDYFFPRKKFCIHFDQRWVVLQIGRFFSRTHLVTLLPDNQ
jgi:hypothetical protein